MITRMMIVGLLFWGSLTSVTAASEESWRLDKDKKGIQVYTRAVEGSDIRAIRATTHIQGRLSSIVALLQDVEYLPKLSEVIAAAKVHEQLSETESLIYLQMDLPWPVSDRDGLNHRSLSQDPASKTVTIEEIATRDVIPEEKGFVRILESTQTWTLTPHKDGVVSLNWVTHSDPNGPIPAALINLLSVGVPFDTLFTLREAIEKGEFAEADVPYVQER